MGQGEKGKQRQQPPRVLGESRLEPGHLPCSARAALPPPHRLSATLVVAPSGLTGLDPSRAGSHTGQRWSHCPHPNINKGPRHMNIPPLQLLHMETRLTSVGGTASLHAVPPRLQDTHMARAGTGARPGAGEGTVAGDQSSEHPAPRPAWMLGLALLRSYQGLMSGAQHWEGGLEGGRGSQTTLGAILVIAPDPAAHS